MLHGNSINQLLGSLLMFCYSNDYLLSARKDSQTSQIFIESQAYHITHIDVSKLPTSTLMIF